MGRCRFCEILSGRAPAYYVYRGDRVVAFLDKYPVSRGHTLVVPREHYETIVEVPDDLLAEVIRVVKAVARAVTEALGAGGVRIVQNNGGLAGQVIPHVHFHVIPFYSGGGYSLYRRELSPEEGREVSRAISEALGGLL